MSKVAEAAAQGERCGVLGGRTYGHAGCVHNRSKALMALHLQHACLLQHLCQHQAILSGRNCWATSPGWMGASRMQAVHFSPGATQLTKSNECRPDAGQCPPFQAQGGLLAEEAIALLRTFYVTGNPSGALLAAALASGAQMSRHVCLPFQPTASLRYDLLLTLPSSHVLHPCWKSAAW